MRYLNPFSLMLLFLSTSLFAATPEPQVQGSATITVGDDTVTWPVWSCGRVVLAHELAYDDILVDPNLKFVNFGDVVGMVLILNGMSYTADITETIDVHNLDYTGTAASMNRGNYASAGEVEFNIRMQCNP